MSKRENTVNPALFILIAAVVSIISSLGAPLVLEIANHYRISPLLAQWSLTLALISGTVSTPILAKISRFGNYKNVIFLTLLITALGCFLSACTAHFSVFLMGRAMQGIGLGLIPSLMIAARNSLSDSKKTISLLSVTTGIGVGIGYPLSGAMVTYAGIGGTFLCGAVMVLLTAGMSTKLMNLKKKTTEKFDLYGSISITLMLSFLMLFLGALKAPMELKHIGVYGIGFLASVWVWMKRASKHPAPIIHVRVIRLPEALMIHLIALVAGAILYMLITAAMFKIQQLSYPGLAETPLMAGLTLTALSIATLVSRFIHFSTVTSYLRSLMGSLFLFFACMAFIVVEGGIMFCFLSMALCGYGIGLIYGALPHMISDNLTGDAVEETYGLNQVARSVGYAIGSVISVNIISSLFLNESGAASTSSYMALGIMGAIFTLILCSLIMLLWHYYHRDANRLDVKCFSAPDSARSIQSMGES